MEKFIRKARYPVNGQVDWETVLRIPGPGGWLITHINSILFSHVYIMWAFQMHVLCRLGGEGLPVFFYQSASFTYSHDTVFFSLPSPGALSLPQGKIQSSHCHSVAETTMTWWPENIAEQRKTALAWSVVSVGLLTFPSGRRGGSWDSPLGEARLQVPQLADAGEHLNVSSKRHAMM